MAAHSHSHSQAQGDERTAYFMDQLFAVAVCGAIAGVTIVLWQSNLLGRMLHPKFHPIVLAGGIALLVLVTIRAIAVWLEAGSPTDRGVDTPRSPTDEECKHDHGHSHSHAHSHSHSHSHSHAHSPSHAVAHDHGDGHDHGWAPWRYIVLLLPVLLYFLALSNPMFDTEPKVIEQPFSRDPLPYITSFIIIFRSILWEALPFIVLGAVIAGLLEEFLPPWLLTYLIPRNPFLAVGIGGLLGIVFPICECGIVPIMRRLLRKGLPLSCCVAYLLAGPIVNIVVLLSTMAAFSGMENTYLGGQPTYQMSNWWMTGFRAGLGYIVAVVTGLLVEWMWRKHGEALLTPVTRPSNLPMADENGNNLHEKRSLWQRISNVSETALHDFVDITVFLILGAMLAAGSRMFLTPERIAELGSQHAILAIVLMMGLAVMLCLCSEADAFVAASFVTLQPSAKLSFLVLGPMLDFKLYAMYTVIFRPKLIMTIYIAVIGQVLVYSVATHYFWETFKTQLVTPREPESTVNDDELKESVTRLTSFVGILGGAPLASNPGAAGLLALDPIERVMEMSFLRLENAAQDANLRQYYLGKTVAMSGRFSGSDRGFMLVRYKYNCCAADAVPLQAYLVPDDPNKGVPAQRYQGKWVKVAGRIDFRPDRKGGYTPFIVLPITEKTAWEKIILEIEQPANPFIY